MTDEKTVEATIDYRTAEGISYSALSRLADGPKAYIDKDKPEGDFLDNGSAVDVLLTEGEEAFHKQFYVMTATKPTSDMMLRYTLEMIESDNPQLAMAASGYKRAVSDAKWEEEGKPYYDAVKAAGDKTVLDFDQYQKIQATVNQLLTNDFTKYFFGDYEIWDLASEELEIHYQFEHYFDLTYVDEVGGKTKQRKAKIKTDILIIDHKRKKVFGKDLKTTSKPTSSFLSSYRTYKYYLQEGLYQEGVMDYRDKNYPDYEVSPFEFIVAQIGAYSEPLIFNVSEEQHGHNFYGGKTASGYQIKGVAQLLCDLDYYEEMNKWDYLKEVVENNGRVNIDMFRNEKD